jgi:8-oxo-dGTP pyrophosphatase MutT (NUDIX family)
MASFTGGATAREQPRDAPDELVRGDLASIAEALASHGPETIADEGQRRAAVAVLLRPCGERDADIECFLIKRAEDPRDPWSGHMAFPGGRVDPEDKSPYAAAVRECREEVGLDLEALGAQPLGQLDEIVAVAKGRRLPLIITPFVFSLAGVAPAALEPRANHEVEATHWISGRELRDPAAVSTRPYVFEGKRWELPCFRIQERVIWGLTYQMLMRFFGAVGWPQPSRKHPAHIRE